MYIKNENSLKIDISEQLFNNKSIILDMAKVLEEQQKLISIRLKPFLEQQREMEKIRLGAVKEATLSMSNILKDVNKTFRDIKKISSAYESIVKSASLPLKEMQETINISNKILTERLATFYSGYYFNELLQGISKNSIESLNWANISELCDVIADNNIEQLNEGNIEEIYQYTPNGSIESEEEFVTWINTVVEEAIKKEDNILLNPYFASYIYPLIVSLLFYMLPYFTTPAIKDNSSNVIEQKMLFKTAEDKIKVRALKDETAEVISYIPENCEYNAIAIVEDWIYVDFTIDDKKIKGWINKGDLLE